MDPLILFSTTCPDPAAPSFLSQDAFLQEAIIQSKLKHKVGVGVREWV